MMKNTPLISVVIPSFNGQKFLKEAIESVINQTYRSVEIILVDDGSTDMTPEIMLEYSKKYPNILFHQHSPNLGLPSALNTGFANAKGDYYTWISDDNIFKNNALEVMAGSISDADIIYANYDSINEDKVIISNQQVGKIENIIFHYVIGPCFLYKANCHHKVNGYDTNIKLCEDYDFFLRLFYENFSFKKINQSLFFFRIHQQQMSSNSNKLLLATETIIIENAKKNHQKIARRDLSKIYLSRFLKNKYSLKLHFLLMAFYYSPAYPLFRLHKILFHFLARKK